MSSTSINRKLVEDITNLLPADNTPTTLTTLRASSSTRTSILRPATTSPFIDPNSPAPKMYIVIYGSGFVQNARNHLHIGSGLVTKVFSCAKLIEVRPTDAQMAAEFVAAGYDHFLIRAKDRLLGMGEAFLDEDDTDFDDVDKGERKERKSTKRSLKSGDLALGYWTNEHGCFQYGVGEVVKVWKHFKVRFVDPERGVDPGERLKTEFRKVRFDIPEEEEEDQTKGKNKDKPRVICVAKEMALRSANYVICWRRKL
ncbi:hypothetical protein BJX62DRAFT_232694 [Aspergillus germanicus]